MSRRPLIRSYVRRAGARGVLATLVASAAVTGATLAPAHAAGDVTVDADGKGAVIDRTYSTELSVRGKGFQSIKGGHGGIYVWFGTVNGKWRPSQGGKSGVNYVYVPDSESKNNAGFQRYVAFPGSSTASSANGGTMSADGAWSVKLVVPGPTFEAVGRNGKITQVDCRKVTCGVITVGAHGVQNGNNETFTPVRLGDLGGTGATDQEAPAASGEQGTTPSGTPATSGEAGPASAPTTTNPQRRGPLKMGVDHAAAVSGRAMSFTAQGLTPGEQFTVVLDDGLAAAGPFTVGADGRVSGVIQLPASTKAGTHELRAFGASRDLSVKFGVQTDPALETVSAETSEEQPVAGWVFAGVAGVVFLAALAFALRRAGGRRAQA
ncbi:hypothetical protein [Nocardioides jishulii]|uniref:Uncharacterized protein n=1 Tax=Nocardioides jishulii TaxID=2575440 RepID=A0A4U2YJR4_9ACTN|nr:hypothetical protein [Nocardioides jishulii]QCX28270.1 hypothetical protein FCL41_12605 [Nocardioides jishulii]TKI60934.1 hypothetical protein FC770_15675 [Nocardioides jishulii]